MKNKIGTSKRKQSQIQFSTRELREERNGYKNLKSFCIRLKGIKKILKELTRQGWCWKIVNPLTTNVKYTWHDTVVTSDSCNSGHSENYEIFWHFRVRAWNFIQNGIQNFVIWLIHSWEIALQSQIFNI